MTTPIVPNPDSADNLKQCNRCGKLKPRSEFYRCSKKPGGIEYRCKECSAEQQRDWRARKDPDYKPLVRVEVIGDHSKRCSICGEMKPITEYYPRPDRLLGVETKCKACCSAYSRQHNAKLSAARAAANPREVIPDGMKRCKTCREIKTADHFGPEKRSSDGLDANCRTCRASYYRERAAANRPLKEVLPSGMKRCRTCGQVLRTDLFYSGRSSDGLRGSCKKCVEYKQGHVRRARVRSMPNSFTRSDWNAALSYFDNRCAVCGRQIGIWHKMAADHWIPLSSPDCPGTVPWNIVPLCHGAGGCNNQKSDRSASVWLASKFGKRKAREIQKRVEDYLASRKPVSTETA